MLCLIIVLQVAASLFLLLMPGRENMPVTSRLCMEFICSSFSYNFVRVVNSMTLRLVALNTRSAVVVY